MLPSSTCTRLCMQLRAAGCVRSLALPLPLALALPPPLPSSLSLPLSLPLPSSAQHRPCRRSFAAAAGAHEGTPFTEERAVHVVRSSTTDPFFNIAAEDHLFRTLPPAAEVLYLWQNEPTVFIGRNQNPWKETHTQQLERDGVHLVRRTSGGGAVYQDLGNVCWTFLSSQSAHNKHDNNQCLVDALSSLGVTAEASGRNDIVVSGSKVSGSAFRIANNRVCHHGTMLLNVDLSAMGKYLNPNKAKLESKGVKSVQARVLNLRSILPRVTTEQIMSAISSSFLRQRNVPVEDSIHVDLDHDSLAEDEQLKKMVHKMKDWVWRFGETPAFEHNLEHRFDWGIMDVHVDTKHGLINNVKVFSDSLHPDMVDIVQSHMKAIPYSVEGVRAAMEIAAQACASEFEQECVREFSRWLEDAL
eukprot:TRINITY_DN11651_c0_g1_i1.p1 TRINITY_DN11651_c0_g1~~TRINITY_DN11651_c0_g1_i1.p1  ORF type:complete len:423 (+),score=96.12 TRINITY_DN11651_c0_g1_i1:25-1269(+)